MSWKRRLALFTLAALVAFSAFFYLRPIGVLEAAGETALRLRGVHSRQVTASGYRLRYLEAGSGPPLVLVHGLGSTAMRDWGRNIPPLARAYHVYAPDLPGFGRSEQPKDASYSIPMQVEAVRSFMAAVGLPRARVAGLSMGGWIAARLAGEHPELVERLVLVAPAGMRPIESAPIPVEVLFPHDVDGMHRLIAAVRHKPPAAPTFLVRDMLAWKRRDEWIVRRTLESMRDGDDFLDGKLARVNMPVLIIWGKQDVLIPAAYAEPLHAEIPAAKLTLLDGCGHVVMADCPEPFDRELEAFLAAAPARAASTRP